MGIIYQGQQALIVLLVECVKQDLRDVETSSEIFWDNTATYQQLDMDERWAFLKTATLGTCHFNENPDQSTEEWPCFALVDSQGKSLLFSNRPSTNSELRGGFLRNQLLERQQTHPQETVYKALQNICSRPVTAEGFRKLATTQEMLDANPLSQKNDVIAISPLHFSLFIAGLREEMLLQSSNPQSNAFDAASIYENTLKLAEQIENNIKLVKLKQENLQKRGHTPPAKILSALHEQLSHEKEELAAGKISLDQFKQRCQEHIDTALNDENLNEHRKPLSRFFNQILSELLKNFGLNNSYKTKMTDTVKQIIELRETLQNLRQSASGTKEKENTYTPK